MKYESTARLSLEAINDLIAENYIYDITIQDPNNYPEGKTYDIFALLSVKRAIIKFLEGCPYREAGNPNTEKEIFAYIYTKLAYWATYDELASEVIDYKPEFKALYAADYLKSASGLEGVMIGRNGVCSSFAESLRNLLAERGIEAKYVTGWTKGENGENNRAGHAWNQVKLDGEWYNCDITCDRKFILEGLVAPKFLKSNADFSNYYRYPSGRNVKIEKATKSISSQGQDYLIGKFQSQIVSEMFPKDDEKKKRKKGFLESISEKLKSRKGSEKGENWYG